jgi:glycosyltransferase involved in cell wall biosynthesis
MKVLLLSTSFPLHEESQSGIFIQQMVENLPEGIEVRVLTPDDRSSPNTPFFAGTYKVHRYRYAPKSWQELAHGSGGIMAALSQNKCRFLLLPVLLSSCAVHALWDARKTDIIHANWSINGVIANIIGLLLQKPVIITLRGSDVNLATRSWLMRQLVGNCLSLGQCLVTVSPSLQQMLTKQFPRYKNKIQVVANGISQEFFHVGEGRGEARTGLVRFLYAGNLLTSKGVQVLLEAAALLAPESEWCLDLVGDGPERRKFEEFCKKNELLCERVTFHGAVSYRRMPHFLAQADVFVFASFSEGRPNAVMEALAAGLAVLAAAIPALQEVMTNGQEGLLFPPGDSRKLSQSMAYLLNHPQERQRMGRNAHRSISALGLSWQETGQQYAALYAALLARSHGS